MQYCLEDSIYLYPVIGWKGFFKEIEQTLFVDITISQNLVHHSNQEVCMWQAAQPNVWV